MNSKLQLHSNNVNMKDFNQDIISEKNFFQALIYKHKKLYFVSKKLKKNEYSIYKQALNNKNDEWLELHSLIDKLKEDSN